MVDGLAQNLLDINLQVTAPTIPSFKGFKSQHVGKDILRDTAEQFEAFFLHTVLESMTETIGSEDVLGGGGHAEKIWRSQMNEQFANAIAKSGGVGIADSVYKELLAKQEEVNNEQVIKPESGSDSGESEHTR